MRSFSAFSRCSLLAAIASCGLLTTLPAATLIWDSIAENSTVEDGAGIWSSGGPNWRNVTSSMDDQSFTNGDVVTFGAGNGAAGTVTVSGTVSTNSITFVAPGSGSYTLGGTGTISMTTGTITANTNATISAIIGGTGNLTKVGAGTLTLSGANTYNGALLVTQGAVRLVSAAAAGTTGGNVTVSSGAALEFSGGITYGTEALTLNGTGVSGGGALRNITGTNTWGGGVVVNSASQINVDAGAINLNGVISGGAANSLTLSMATGTTITFGGTGSNSFTGPLNVNSGTLILAKAANSDSQLPQAVAANTTINIGNGTALAVVRLGGNNQINDTGTVLNFTGSGATAGIFRTNGLSDTVGTIRSTGGAGIIENGHASTISTVTINNSTNDTFSGIIQNGAAAALNFAKTNTGTLTLTGINTYTGSTTVSNGTLELSGSGSLLNTTALTLGTRGTLKLNNTSSSNSANRFNNAVAVTMNGGGIALVDDGSNATYAESFGAVQLAAGASSFTTTSASAGSTTLTLASLTRSRGATASFTGANLGLSAQNRILISSPPATDNTLIGGWAVTGNEFAKYDATNGVTALTASDYETGGQAAWDFESNAKQTTSTALTADRNVNSVNLAQSGSITLDLGGRTLRVESGGMLVSGAFDSVISNGTLTGGTSVNSAGELVIHQQSANTLDINAVIADNGTRATTLVKGGGGTLRLSGVNTFTGGVFLNEGTLQVADANAINAANTLAVEGGTLDLNGNDVSVAALSSQNSNTSGTVTNTTGGTKTLAAGSNNASTSFSGTFANGTGLNFTKTGTGTLVFNQQNSTYGGIITIANGVLTTGNANALGSATGATDKTVVLAGGTLDISGGINRSERLDIAGHGFNGQGAIIANSGPSQNIQFANLTGHTTLSVNIRYDFDNTLTGNDFTLTKIGSAELALEGGAVTGLGDIHIKQNNVTWSGSADLGNAANTLYVNSGTAAQFYNKGSDVKKIVLNGGTLRRIGTAGGAAGNTIDASGGITIAAGASTIASSQSSLIFKLNTINRNLGATLNFENTGTVLAPTTAATTDSGNVNGIIGGYATVGGITWAVNSGSTAGAVTGLVDGSYSTNDFTLDGLGNGRNVNVATGIQGPATFTANSLRFHTAGAATLNLTGTNTIFTGGILVTATVGNNLVTIAGETLRGAEGRDLVIIQNNTANSLAISASIADNTSATALTKSGLGRLILSGNNLYTGGTFLNSGTTEVSLISDSGNSNLGNSSGGSNGITFNGDAILQYTGTGDAVTSRNITLLSGGGRFNINSGRTLDLSGIVSGENLANGEGFYASEGTLAKEGAGTLTLSGSAANAATGNTIVNEGILRLNKTAGVNAIAGNLVIGNSTGATDVVLLGASNQIADASLVTLNGTGATAGILRLANNSETIGGLVSGGNGAGIVENESGSAGTGTLDVNVAANITHTFSGILRNGDGTGTDGTLAFTKSGDGIQVLTGTNTYTGVTNISGGILQVGAGSTTGSISNSSGIAFSNNGTLSVNRSNALTVSQAITGSGNLVQAGSGTTTLTSTTSTYAGQTLVTSGVLLANNASGSATGVSAVLVTGGTLGGTGRIAGNTTIQESGLLTPGDASVNNGIGTLTFAGDLTLKRDLPSETARLTMQLGLSSSTVFNDAANLSANMGNLPAYFTTALATYEAESGTHDRLIIGGSFNVDAGAVIALDTSLGYVLKFGDVLDLFDWATFNGSTQLADRSWSLDEDLLLPTLSSGLKYDLSLFSSNGIVLVVPEPARPMLLMLALSLAMLHRRRRK